MKCPCGSDIDQRTCCSPIIDGTMPAPTAEALMRARYTAHATGRIPFLRESLAPEVRDGFDEDEVRAWSTQSEWLGLRILSSSEKARRGTVKFVATYRANGRTVEHHEVATFRRDETDGRWYFLDGRPRARERADGEEEIRPVTTIVRDAPKVGRNDPCLCGSGKKFKKCCGK